MVSRTKDWAIPFCELPWSGIGVSPLNLAACRNQLGGGGALLIAYSCARQPANKVAEVSHQITIKLKFEPASLVGLAGLAFKGAA